MKTKAVQGAEVRVADWLDSARRELADAEARPEAGQHFIEPAMTGEESHREANLEAQLLLAHVLGKPRAWVIAHPEALVAADQRRRLNDLLAQRVQGMPLPYLRGEQAFYGLDFEVTPDVLIPRPETELLVEQALEFLANRPNSRTADVGAGSGCITVSLLVHQPSLRVLAVDSSGAALRVARRNASRHRVSARVVFAQADLLTAAAGPFDLVCANLPYIPQQALHNLTVARYEPRQALDGGPDGLNLIRRLLADSPRWLAPGGQMLLEMQYDQGDAITQMAHQYLPQSNITVLQDLAGLPRLVKITR